MTIDTPELVWLETYARLARAEEVRGFLQSRGIAGAVVVGHSAGGHDLMVAPAEAAKALALLADEDRVESERSDSLASEVPDDASAP